MYIEIIKNKLYIIFEETPKYMKPLRILAIADLHFGKLPDSKALYEELKTEFIEYANKVSPDLIVICGDSFDSRQTVESEANIYFNKFIDDCRSTNATIIIFEGTYSHDRFQINSLSHYANEKFIIINTVASVEVCGLKILILPEEYIKDETYYKEYFSNNYDFVFFHGMFDHVGINVSDYLGLSKKAFTFNWKMFENNVNYYVCGGHIHTPSMYKNIIYCGSFTRLNFGEEEDKGFREFIVDDKGCQTNFIVNKKAKLFSTILASNLPTETESLLKQLRGYSESNDYLRIIIDITDDNSINTIEGFVKQHPNCVIKRKYLERDEKENERISLNMKEKQQVLHDRMDKYKNMDFIEITRQIAKTDYNTEFETEYINKVLNTKL